MYNYIIVTPNLNSKFMYTERNCVALGVLGTRTWMASLSIGLVLLYTAGPRRATKAWLPLLLLSWG